MPERKCISWIFISLVLEWITLTFIKIYFPPLFSPTLLPYLLTYKYYIHVIVYMYIIYEKYEFPWTVNRSKFQMLHCLVSLGSLSILVLYPGNKNYSRDFPYITRISHENHDFICSHINWIFFFFLTCYWSSKHFSYLMYHLKARFRCKGG